MPRERFIIAVAPLAAGSREKADSGSAIDLNLGRLERQGRIIPLRHSGAKMALQKRPGASGRCEAGAGIVPSDRLLSL
jgi:hypothetical protein